MSHIAESEHRATPFINVTPLIDVLLVMLIIFMVVTPLKPARFMAKLPEEKDQNEPPLPPPVEALVVTIEADLKLKLNQLAEDMGSVDDTSKVSLKLAETFAARIQNHAWRYEMIGRNDVRDELRIQRTVFIKAPRSIEYGLVAKVIDGIKGAGAEPIGLQLDDLK